MSAGNQVNIHQHHEQTDQHLLSNSHWALLTHKQGVDCWAYVGATAFFVMNWEGWSVGDLEAGVSGTAGFNFELEVTIITNSISYNNSTKF